MRNNKTEPQADEHQMELAVAEKAGARSAILASQGPQAAVEQLIATAREAGQARPLLDALILKARLDLGLAPAGLVTEEIPPDLKTAYEDKFVDALRTVGQMLLDKGEIPAAWPYFRVIGEKETIKNAIERFDPTQADEHGLGAIIEIAFQQQVHPIKGFGWILDRYGICSAISSFEAMPADESVRAEGAALLTRSLYDQLQFSLASEIERREGARPGQEASVEAMLQGRAWIYDDDAYAIDISHLSSVVRLSPLLKHDDYIELARQLAIYGNGLSDRFRYDGLPPFEDVYADHLIYLNALLGRDAEKAVAHFQAKLQSPEFDDEDQPPDPLETLPAQTLVRLLARLGRKEEAIAVAAEHLMRIPESYLMCPGVSALCREAKRPDLLAEAAAKQQDWALFLGAKIEEMQSRA